MSGERIRRYLTACWVRVDSELVADPNRARGSAPRTVIYAGSAAIRSANASTSVSTMHDVR